MGEAQMSDSFRTAAMLAFVGGFLETYTFVLHGHVFANAQTGGPAGDRAACCSRADDAAEE